MCLLDRSLNVRVALQTDGHIVYVLLIAKDNLKNKFRKLNKDQDAPESLLHGKSELIPLKTG